MSQAQKRKRGKKEIVFDPEARKAYLRGFSDRKRQRRAFGLAMQQVKDRKAKIDQRKQDKKDELERVEEAERQKEELMEGEILNLGTFKNYGGSDVDSNSDDDSKEEAKATLAKGSVLSEKTYDDKQAERQWGGSVTVTTSVVTLDDDSDDEEITQSSEKRQKRSNNDEEQKHAGNVQRYLDKLKGNMPSKKKQNKSFQRKGKNGAAEMRGMGGSKNLNVAQKVLARTKAKSKGGSIPNKRGKRSRNRR